MEINGIDLSSIEAHKVSDFVFPDPVKGRVVSIDADFLAYMMSYVKEGEHKTWEDMKHNCEVFVELIKNLAGATGVHLHLTPASSNKGYRPAIAQLKEYQANRKGDNKPEYLHVMREWMGKHFPATQHQFCEADDGMSMMQYTAIKEGNRNLHVIATKDKDLSMVPGLHLNWDKGTVHGNEDYGHISVELVGKTKKVKGYGQKFFWAQMLIGDTADNISGLPLVSVAARERLDLLPESVLVLRTQMDNSIDGLKKIKYEAALSKVKPSKVGPVAAYDILRDVNSNREAAKLVMDLYRDLDGSFTHWKTGKPITWQQAFLSEAALLWMRRQKDDPADVKKFLQEILR